MRNRALENRIDTEKKIFAKTVDAAIAAGYGLRLHDGEDWCTSITTDKKVLMEAMFSTDEDRLYFYKKTNLIGEKDAFSGPQGWVYFVYGNYGHDVISDYTVNLEEVLAPVNEYADTFC